MLLTLGSISSQAHFKAYVRTQNGATIATELFKNFVVIQNTNNDGFILMSAVVKSNGTREYWQIRLIATDLQGNIQNWSYDYGLLEATFPISTTPFAITTNLNNTGYVICGAWQPSTNTSLRHEGLQHPFYMEIDTLGNVTKTHRGTINNGTMGFVPLSICKGVNEYLVAGVQSDDFECVSCGRKMGRVAKLDTSFAETSCMTLSSNYTIVPTVPPLHGSDSYFDALGKIKKVPGVNQFIISGSVTENISDDPTCTAYGSVGISAGYIARIDSALNIVWEKKFKQNSTSPIHFTVPDFAIDTATENIYLAVQWIIDDAANGIPLHFARINSSNGAIQKESFFDAGLHLPSNYTTNIYFDNNYVYACGFANDTMNASPERNHLLPHIIILEKDNPDSIVKAFYLHANNGGYPSLLEMDGYLGHRYINTNTNFEDIVVFNKTVSPTCNQTQKSDLTYSPVIYAGSSWVYCDSMDLACIAPHNSGPLVYRDTFTHSTYPQYFPSLYYAIDSAACYYNEIEFDTLPTPYSGYSITTLTSYIHWYSSVDSPYIDSTIYNTLGFSCDSTLSGHEPDAELIHLNSNVANTTQIPTIISCSIYDVMGRFIFRAEPTELKKSIIWKLLPNGVYIIHFESDEGTVMVRKWSHE
ncbi:MAG: T9SS type A sorting domain-containing protein [Flavobacteriales bacterium]|nr:T9SS type A sorting domain-containing protein [Flavobacteriales bacterium]